MSYEEAFKKALKISEWAKKEFGEAIVINDKYVQFIQRWYSD